MTSTSMRTFTENEQANRDAYITSHIENDCAGCYSYGDLWRPTEHCPVHGLACETWWEALNKRLDERWPGTWGPLEEATAC